jgi:hypothetical protein
MTRVTSQFTFCSPSKILRQAVIEQNNFNITTAIFNLGNSNIEPANTLFLDGIISNAIISLKENIRAEKIAGQTYEYQYLDLSYSFPIDEIKPTKKPLILDFGTNDFEVINNTLTQTNKMLMHFTVFEIIAACTYYPALLLNISNSIEVNNYSRLVLWENIDFENKKITQQTRIRVI